MAKDDLLDGLNRGPQIDPTRYPRLKCDKCGHDIFRDGYIIYNIPGMVIGTGTNDYPYPLHVYICDKCGEIIKSVRDELDKIEKEKENQENKEVKKGTTLIL